jgi:hypothetical protein
VTARRKSRPKGRTMPSAINLADVARAERELLEEHRAAIVECAANGDSLDASDAPDPVLAALAHEPTDGALVHYSDWASQPDVKIACDQSIDRADIEDPGVAAGVYVREDGRLYAFELTLVTCPKCQSTRSIQRRRLTNAQARLLREAEHICQFHAGGADIATCERLRAAGLMRLATRRVYRVTAAGRRWLNANHSGGAS